MMQVRAWLPVWLPMSLVSDSRSGGGLSYCAVVADRSCPGWLCLRLARRSAVGTSRGAFIVVGRSSSRTGASRGVGRTCNVPEGGGQPGLLGDLAARPGVGPRAGDNGTAEKSARLHAAAVIYRDLALRRADRLGRQLPVVLCVVLAAQRRCSVGMSLFVPFSELMQKIP